LNCKHIIDSVVVFESGLIMIK